jgi:hypothetical protein
MGQAHIISNIWSTCQHKLEYAPTTKGNKTVNHISTSPPQKQRKIAHHIGAQDNKSVDKFRCPYHYKLPCEHIAIRVHWAHEKVAGPNMENIYTRLLLQRRPRVLRQRDTAASAFAGCHCCPFVRANGKEKEEATGLLQGHPWPIRHGPTRASKRADGSYFFFQFLRLLTPFECVCCGTARVELGKAGTVWLETHRNSFGSGWRISTKHALRLHTTFGPNKFLS